MTECCAEKASARKHGLFDGPAGDSWYICECEKKKQIPKIPIIKKIRLLLRKQ
jgi:hypothetical protein